MAVTTEDTSAITAFEQWYVDKREDSRTGCLDYRGFSKKADALYSLFTSYKSEMDARLAGYEKLEMIADGEVISPKKDLPNISSGETAGIVRRIARMIVQNTPNTEIISKFDADSSVEGVLAKYILDEKVIGSDSYSNDMQQNLFVSTVSALTLGFDAVIPVLLQDTTGGWFIKYDQINYRDVFPESGAKDIRQAENVFVRRYLTKGEVQSLIRNQVAGWDIAALKLMLKSNMPSRQHESATHQDRKHRTIPEGYEVITWYSSTGDPFLTFAAREKVLLRIEKNKHPYKTHPVFFLVLEKDRQPLGKSQVELLLGRQEFQDLMLNGAMKLWYRNINPPLIGYGTVNAIPNLSPGKYTTISNPNAKVEAFEVNTQTLLQYGQISEQNLGSMVNLVGAADQQMATQAGNGMSATPQGVDAQQALVSVTTNNYQKAIEAFFSHYCSYALTLYFHELGGIKTLEPSADARKKLLNGGMPPEAFAEDGTLKLDFRSMKTLYFVKSIPGSLIEMESEKQLRILNSLFIPLSQAMPAMAQTGNQEMLANAAAAMQFIVQKEIELSGSSHSTQLKELLQHGSSDRFKSYEDKTTVLEQSIGTVAEGVSAELDGNIALIKQLQEQISMLAQTQDSILQALGATKQTSSSEEQGNVPAPQPALPN